MDKWLKEVFPIWDIEHNAILSKQGDITIGFKVTLPELFTLSGEEYEALHQTWVKAIKVLPKHSVFHKQDWYTTRSYQLPQSGPFSFLNQAAARHFNGRPYLKHTCYIYLTKKPENRKPSTSLFSSLIRGSMVPEQALSPDKFQNFLDCCGQFKQILQATGLVQLARLQDDDFTSARRKQGVIEQYCTLSSQREARFIQDIELKTDRIKIGGKHCQLYTLGDAADLPSLCGPRITYDKYSTDATKFSIGFAASVGLLLPCNHIYNQYIFKEDAQETLHKLERKRLRLQSLSAYSRENLIAKEATDDFLTEAISEQRLPVKAHFNVLVWTENPEELKDLKNQVSAALAEMDAVAKQETAGAAQIFWAGIPGNGADFPVNDTFDTFLEQATCFLSQETGARSDDPKESIRFCDRFGVPVLVDPFNAPRTAGISSNMGMLVCGSSGAGKSMLVNHFLRTLHEQDAHCVVVDIGGSYKGLCELVGGYYFTYTESNPIRFNPFYLPAGDILDIEKKESLKSLLIALWKQEHEPFNRSEYVALSNALQGYYQLLDKDKSLFPCFNTFYEYLQNDYAGVLQTQRVKDKDFDLDNFLYVLQPYYRDGEFDYLLNAKENLDLLSQSFIVIELDNIKDHPIFPVVTLIIMELFISKMRKLAGVRKVLMIDEAWKAIAKSGMAEFLKYAFKTIRKFDGIPGVITQELDDLVSSPIIKDAIINNADVKILLDMRKFSGKFDKLQETLGLSEKGKTMLLSVNKDQREFYLEVGGQIMKVLRNELSREEYFAYTTEGKERVKVMEYAQKYGGMELGIQHLLSDMEDAKN